MHILPCPSLTWVLSHSAPLNPLSSWLPQLQPGARRWNIDEGKIKLNDPDRTHRRLAAADYDLAAWRAAQEKKGGKDWAEGFAVMDLDDAAPWDFACQVRQGRRSA